MTGKEMCSLSKEEFCSRAPVFVGDILWEHLVLLQQDVDRECAALKNAPSTLSEISTEPVSLPPSPPRHQSHLYPVSPQKTYLTLSSSPQRPQQPPYSAPSPPVSYTSLDTSALPVTIKSEYPSSSGQQYGYQYHPYQRVAPQPYQHYAYPQPQPHYEMSQSYPGYQPSPVTVPVERWAQQPASYQVKEDNITLLTSQTRPPSNPI